MVSITRIGFIVIKICCYLVFFTRSASAVHSTARATVTERNSEFQSSENRNVYGNKIEATGEGRSLQAYHDHNLETIILGGSAQSGAMFDVVAKKDITITGLEIHTSSEVNEYLEVWTKDGTWQGFHMEPAYWYMVSCQPIVGAGYGTFTEIPSENLDWIYVKGSNVKAIYTTLVRICAFYILSY